ncbi:MAG: arsenate reductase/protein-tyrosine-phosphatase family protein [Acidiferrobacterales bacterium]
MVAHYQYLLAYHTGFWRKFERVDWMRVERLVFVCMGNICRSPYAEVVAAGFQVPVVSAGLGARRGAHANLDAIRNAERRGIDLGSHVARRLDDLKIGPADLLIGMEPWQAQRLRRNGDVRRSRAQVTLLGIWCNPPEPYIADPYGCGDGYFQTCYSHIDAGIARILEQIRRRPADCGSGPDSRSIPTVSPERRSRYE